MHQFFISLTGKDSAYDILAIHMVYNPDPASSFFCFICYPFSKIWALQDGTEVIIGGKTNRAKGEFPEEMNLLLDQVPELVESSSPKQSDVISG